MTDPRSSSSSSTTVMRSSASPRRCSTVTGVSGPRCSSSASFTSERTKLVVALRDQDPPGELGRRRWRGRRRRARRPSIGSTPRRDPGQVGERHARDQLDARRTAASRSSATVRSATAGLPGTAYTTSTVPCAAATSVAAISAYADSRSGAASYTVVERLERDAGGHEVVDRGVVHRAREALRRRHQRRARATGRRWSAPAGPRPTTTIRSAMTRRLARRARGEALAARGRAHSVARVPRAVPRVHVDVVRLSSRVTNVLRASVLESPSAFA